MPNNVLLTGVSGYLGGTLLTRFDKAQVNSEDNLFALVRNDDQAEAVRGYGAEPLIFDAYDEKSIIEAITNNKINIVFYLIDCNKFTAQEYWIRALAAVKQSIGQDVHFIYTTGTKQFGSPAGAPHDRPLRDTDPQLYDIQKNQKSDHEWTKEAVDCNCRVVESGAEHGVQVYVFSPCIVYGKGEGFGNKISIQTVDIVKAALAAGRVYKPEENMGVWPQCHVRDTVGLYIHLLNLILSGTPPDQGKYGYYLASTGPVNWNDLYAAMAKALFKHGAIDTADVTLADQAALEKMAKALDTYPSFVSTRVAGMCSYTAEHGRNLGWKPEYSAEHIIQAADNEVAIILESLAR